LGGGNSVYHFFGYFHKTPNLLYLREKVDERSGEINIDMSYYESKSKAGMNLLLITSKGELRLTDITLGVVKVMFLFSIWEITDYIRFFPCSTLIRPVCEFV